MEQHSIEIRFGIAEVLWVRPDGTFHRKSYNKTQKEEFVSEVLGATTYLQELCWMDV